MHKHYTELDEMYDMRKEKGERKGKVSDDFFHHSYGCGNSESDQCLDLNLEGSPRLR